MNRNPGGGAASGGGQDFSAQRAKQWRRKQAQGAPQQPQQYGGFAGGYGGVGLGPGGYGGQYGGFAGGYGGVGLLGPGGPGPGPGSYGGQYGGFAGGYGGVDLLGPGGPGPGPGGYGGQYGGFAGGYGYRTPRTAMLDDRTVPGVCHNYNSPKSKCTRNNCQELHVCFYYFATGKCRYGDKCIRPHLLTNVHNQAVLKANGWHHDNHHPKILRLLEEKFQQAQGAPQQPQQPAGGAPGGYGQPQRYGGFAGGYGGVGLGPGGPGPGPGGPGPGPGGYGGQYGGARGGYGQPQQYGGFAGGYGGVGLGPGGPGPGPGGYGGQYGGFAGGYGHRTPGTAMPDDGTVPGVCHNYNSPKSKCTRNNCQELHVCFNFVTGKCRYGDKCIRPHLLTDVHNQAVLKANGWHRDNQHPKILRLLEEKFKPKADKLGEEKTDGLSTPQICLIYNTLGCGNDDCKNLHLCLNSVMNKCALGGKCHLEHDLVKSDHNIQVLRSAKLLDTEQKLIADNLREKYIAMSNQQSRHEPKKKECEPKQEEKSAQEPKVKEPPTKQDAEKDNPKSSGTPTVCIPYNNGGCNNASCQSFHLCFDRVMGKCNKNGKCLREQFFYNGKQNIEMLRKYNLFGAAGDPYAKIREGHEATVAAKAAAIEASDGASGGATPPPSAAQSRAIPPASLTCSMCCETVIRATTLGCTHTFCEDCVRRAERQGMPCPLCRAPIATAVRSVVIDDTVAEWFDGQDEETQRARRQLETERRRAAAVPQPLMGAQAAKPAADPAPKRNNPPGGKQQQRSRSRERGAKTVVTTSVTYH